MNFLLTELTQRDEYFEFDFIFKTNLEYESGDQGGSSDKKRPEVKNLMKLYCTFQADRYSKRDLLP
jgi:hypothetical protein